MSAHAQIKKEQAQSASKKKALYSRDALLPKEIIAKLPFKNTRKALRKEDRDALKELLCSFVATLAEKTYTYSWPKEQNEQQVTIQGLVYLDALIRLYRMPPQFEFAMGDLSTRFKNIPEETL